MSRIAAPRYNTRFLGILRVASRIGIQRKFRGLFLAGEENITAKDTAATNDQSAYLFCPNHSNWWDGFVAAIIHHELCPDLRFALLQEEQHLASYPFFRKAGVIGLDLRSPGASVGGLRRALAFLSTPPAGLWVFPQGMLLDAATPVTCQPGASYLARRQSVPLVPVGIRYAWMRESKPTIFVRLGVPLHAPTPEALEKALTDLLHTIDSEVHSEALDPYRRVLRGGTSFQNLWDFLSSHKKNRS